MSRTDMRALNRAMTHVREDDNGCWLWTGARLHNGYGQFWMRGRMRLAHRVVWEMFVGEIPDGLQMDHLCRVRHCVRPDHLEPVTGRVNILRGTGPTAINAAKTHCVEGHALNGANLLVDDRGRRACHSCRTRRDALRPGRTGAGRRIALPYWQADKGRWRAEVRRHGVRHQLGYFNTEQEGQAAILALLNSLGEDVAA